MTRLKKPRGILVEPYVVAADIYSAPSLHGSRRLDLVYRLERLDVSRGIGSNPGNPANRAKPCVSIHAFPSHWPSYQVTYRVGATTFQIRVDNPSAVNRGVKQVTLDEQARVRE